MRLPIVDEYRLIRKYFHPLWSVYILILRLFLLRNPLVEVNAFFKNINVKRINVFQGPKLQSEYHQFQSALVEQSPLVTVIIPTLNRHVFLKEALADLAAQLYKNFEVIIVDQNEKLDQSFYADWPFTLRAIHQSEKALWKARNKAVNMAKGEYLLLFDDDSRVEPDWIIHHLKCLDYFKCQLSAGVSISVVGGRVPQNYAYFRWADQLDTGNVLIKRDVFKSIGLFDRQFERQRMGDGEFGLRSYMAGFQSVSNPYAQRLHLKGEIGGLRQMGSWDGWRPKSLFAPRPIPSVFYFYRLYFGNAISVLTIFQNIIPSIVPYRFKKKKSMYIVAILFSFVLSPLLLFQITRSWRLSSKKIKTGPLIQTYDKASVIP